MSSDDPKGAPRAKLWGGRFSQATDPTVERFTASIHFDKALARHDLRLSSAHARMLHAQGLLSAEDEQALRQIADPRSGYPDEIRNSARWAADQAKSR